MTTPSSDRRGHSPTVLYVLIAGAGALGALTRHGIEVVGPSTWIGTLLANALGCLLIGLVVALVAPTNRRLRAPIAGGFVGALTTYSAFVTEAVDLGVSGGVGYIVATYVVGLLLVYLGMAIGTRGGGYRWT